MDIKEMFSIENLSAIGSVCGAIIFTAYISFKTFKSKIEMFIENEKKNVPKNIKKQSSLDYEIMQEAEKVKEILGADRVQVYEFHNGTHYANGRSALKTTCTYEVCRYGIKSCANILSGIPLSIIPNFLNALLEKEELFVKNLNDIKDSMPLTYSLKNTMDIKAFYDVVIHNSNNEPVGFVAVQFCNQEVNSIKKDVVRKFAWFVELKLSEMK